MKKDLYFSSIIYLSFWNIGVSVVGWRRMKKRQRGKGAISVLFSLPSLRSG